MPNWREVLEEINTFRTENQANQELARQCIDIIRRKYLLQLHTKTGRNVIAYYSGFLSKPGISQSAITDEDKNGFMMAVHGLQRDQGLDLILHTPGGNIAATQSLVNYLHKMFGNNIRAIVPQIDLAPLNGSRSYVRVGPKGGPYATSPSHRRTDSRQAP